jgi:hypothetical protein
MITSKKILHGEKEKLLAEINYYNWVWVRLEMPEHMKDFFADLMSHNQYYEFTLKLFRNSPRGRSFFLCFEIVHPANSKSLILATIPVSRAFDAPQNLEKLWLECADRIRIARDEIWIDREEREICKRYKEMTYHAKYKKYSKS